MYNGLYTETNTYRVYKYTSPAKKCIIGYIQKKCIMGYIQKQIHTECTNIRPLPKNV